MYKMYLVEYKNEKEIIQKHIFTKFLYKIPEIDEESGYPLYRILVLAPKYFVID